MTSVVSPWNASARRRRYCLTRYGRGPRKKPPDTRDPGERTIKKLQLTARRRVSSTRTTFTTHYRHKTTVYNTTIGTHLPAPFLAGSRRPFHRISPGYKRRAIAARAAIGGRHGYFRRLWRKVSHGAHIVFQRTCHHFKSLSHIFMAGYKHSVSGILPTVRGILPTAMQVARFRTFLTNSVKTATNLLQRATQYLHQITTSLFMSNSSATLLSNNNSPIHSDPLQSPYCLECTTITSSIASESTTLCPTIPNSISFGSLDGLTVGSLLSIDSMSGGMEDARRCQSRS